MTNRNGRASGSTVLSGSDLLVAIASRMRWEMEHGARGYQAGLYNGEQTEAVHQPPEVTPVPPREDPPQVLEPVPPAVASVEPNPAVQERSTSISEKPAATGPADSLVELRNEIGQCKRCDLHQGRNHVVFGEGDPRARIVFVGEGPGRDEDLAGRPFVGAAGQLLDRIIVAMGLSREQVYICNVVKCRPPSNRVPQEEESGTCGPFVLRQIEIIDPEVVVALGSTAARFLLGRDEPLGRMRGRFHSWNGRQLMATYHPAYLLRNPAGKRSVWEDMQQVMGKLGLTATRSNG